MPKKTGARIYNLFPRLVGKMNNWNTHYKRIADMGFDWVYINPFHYPGFSGSLYAPKDYYDFNPLFVDSSSPLPPAKQLESTIEEAHHAGLKVIMDLVINHTAKDNPFTQTHPDWYLRDENGRIKSPGAWHDGTWIEWGDLAEIDNADSPDKDNLWKYWKELVEFYIDKGIDGFRADAAYQVPDDLWKYLIKSAKSKNKDIVFFAESLGCTPEQTLGLANAGFDYIFNSSKYWDFQESWLMDQYHQTYKIAPSISFPESHDTPRLAEELKDYAPSIRQRTLFTAFFSTGWMITMGFEYGFHNKTDVVHTRPADWEETGRDLSDFIRKINATRKKYAIFNTECEMKIVDNLNWAHVIILLQQTEKERALMIINKEPHSRQDVSFENIAAVMNIPNASTIHDLSLEHKMQHVPVENFHYTLEPADFKLFYAKV